MNEGTLAYIKESIPNPWFSKTDYLESATGVVFKDYRPQGAKWIVITSISLQVPAGAGLLQITDQFGGVLIQGIQQVEMSGNYEVEKVLESGFIKIVSTLPTVNFVVAMQWITFKPVAEQ